MFTAHISLRLLAYLRQVYDITRRSSFETLQAWVKELKQLGPENIIICVCGNKSDLKDKRVRFLLILAAHVLPTLVSSWPASLQEVDTADAKRYAQEINALFFETSAKSSDASGRVQEMFVELARMLPASHEPVVHDTTDLREPKGKGKGGKSGGAKKDTAGDAGGGGCC